MTKYFALAVIFSLTLVSTNVEATTLSDAGTVRGGFILGDNNGRSYDGPGYDAFAPFTGLTSNSLLQFNALTGSGEGETLQFFLLSEAAHYAGTILPGMENQFGVLNSEGNFVSLLQGTNPLGTMAEMTLLAGEQLTFALDSPEGLFSSIDANNVDSAAHMIGMEVVQDGTVTFPAATLFGPAFSFNLLAGDIVLFIEDLLASGNALYGGMDSDFDYNDMVVVIRGGQPIPEPSTYMLVALGLAFFYFQARRRSQLSA